MKKLVLVLGAVVLVASGVSAVSAYEAHLINVTAHVENAMTVARRHIDYGTVFPEEWTLDEFYVRISSSFCAETQTRVSMINYSVYVEWKEDPAGGYYPWLGDAMYIGIDAVNLWPAAAGGDLTYVGPAPPPGPPGAMWVMDSPIPLSKVAPFNFGDYITIGIDVPVFEGYYNALTDVPVKQSGMDHPTVIILESDADRWFPDGVDLGADVKIQVTDIFN